MPRHRQIPGHGEYLEQPARSPAGGTSPNGCACAPRRGADACRSPPRARRPRGARALRRSHGRPGARHRGSRPRADHDAARGLRGRRLRPPDPVPALGHRPARSSSAGRSARAEERAINALLQPLWDLRLTVGQHVRELADFDRDRDRQPGAAAGAARPPASWPATAPLHEQLTARLEAQRATRAPRMSSPRSLDADRGPPRAVQRHHLPARAGREGGARRAARHRGAPAAAAAAARRRPSTRAPSPERAPRRGGVSVPRPLDPARDDRPQLERARRTTLQETVAEAMGYDGGDGAAARRGADVRLLPARPPGRARARAARAALRLPAPTDVDRGRSAGTSRSRPTASASSDPARVAGDAGDVARGVPGGARRRLRGLGAGPHLHRESTSTATPPTTSSRPKATASSCAPCSRRGPGSTPGCRRCTTAGCSAASFPSSGRFTRRVIRDFYHRYTVDEHTLLTIRNIEGLRGADVARTRALRDDARAKCTRRSCSCWRCCITTSASGATSDHAAESVRHGAADDGAAAAGARGAPDGRLPDQAAPGDVARRVPARLRGSRRSSRAFAAMVAHRRAAQDAVPADAVPTSAR